MSHEVCRSFLLLVLPTGACQRKGTKHEATMCLKHVHSGSSLSGALIVNLWLSLDYRFDYRFFFFLRPKATRLLGSSFSDYRFGGGPYRFPSFPTMS